MAPRRPPIWVQGSLAGEYLRESLDLAVWDAAQERVRGWEAYEQIGVIANEIPTIKRVMLPHLNQCDRFQDRVAFFGDLPLAGIVRDGSRALTQANQRHD